METSKSPTSEFENNVYKNMMDTFFDSEITRRKRQNLLPENFRLLAAQAIFFPDGRPHVVKLNEEVSVEVKLKKGIDANVKDFWPSTLDVERILLKEDEFLNCGHATVILFKDAFQLTFDFHYNKQVCSEHLNVAVEFLQTSKYTLENEFVFAFIDNSFSTIELLAKTNLLIEANQNVFGKATHKTIKSAFNLRFKNVLSDFEIKRREIFNQLSEARAKARYLEGTISIEKADLQSIYEIIEAMYHELCNRAGINQS